MLAWPDRNAYDLSRSPRALLEWIAMARVPNTKSAKRSTTRGSQVVAKTKAGTRGAAKPAAPARAVSKDELRSQVQKLERANAALRAKNRQANRTQTPVQNRRTLAHRAPG